VTRPVWRSGRGPGVLIMHEVPGITPMVARFARIVRNEGFTVFLPEMFGEVDKPMTVPRAAAQLLRACISREFHVLASDASSPICDWLRALARDIHAELGGPGVGALGMCLTGNFALALMVDAPVQAPVLSQPSLPLPFGSARKAALHVSEEELRAVKRRVRNEGLSVLGLRFSEDPGGPAARFERLRSELGDAFEAIEIDSSRGNPWGFERGAHSVLTEELVDRAGHPCKEALEQVLLFFEKRLKPS
jgi:dienelactone hydrolase